mmetsp:Transcript_56439/g.112156  ORF Transcript_56439/g.112156 Transcript_56439/m.112156 type:complete len:86 (-) Transcript_56439:918-1175(-)
MPGERDLVDSGLGPKNQGTGGLTGAMPLAPCSVTDKGATGTGAGKTGGEWARLNAPSVVTGTWSEDACLGDAVNCNCLGVNAASK